MKRFSYPRTLHLPWSPGATSDDKMLKSVSHFEGLEVIVTEKRDGENTTMYADGYVHARSIDGTGKDYQSYITAKWREVCWGLRPEIRVAGENLFAKHSLAYDNLDDYFEIFAAYENEICLDWDATHMLAVGLDFETVPVLYRGQWDEKVIRQLCEGLDTNVIEGIVVRNAGEFHMSEFSQNVAKFVRENHVTTDKHWTKNWTQNSLKVK